MMTLKKGDLFNDQLRFSLQKIGSCNSLKTKVAYNFMRLVKILEAENKKFRQEQVDLTKKYVEWENELKKTFKLTEDKTDFIWKEGVDAAAARRDLEEFLQQEIQIARFPFEVEDFEPAKLTPGDIGMLEFMFNQPEE